MKYLFILLVAILLVSCDDGYVPPVKSTVKHIYSKTPYRYNGDALPKGMCRFYYTDDKNYIHSTEFTDSCSFYRVGDVLPFK